MNLHIKNYPEKEEINTHYISELLRKQNKKGGLSFKGPIGGNRISYPILSVEDFERRFQFNNIVRSYNNLIANKKRIENVEGKENSKGFYLPIIKEIKIEKHGMNNDSDFYDTGGYIRETSEMQNQGIKSSSNINSFGNNDLNERYMRSKNYGTNSTLSQSVIFNKSNLNSKMSSDYERERKKIFLKNLSNDSLFAAYKARFLLAKKDFKNKNKLAEIDYKNQLKKMRKEKKIRKSKNEDLFKEYKAEFNENKVKAKLKDEYNFFQNETEKKTISETDLNLDKLIKKIKKNEEKKNIKNYFFMKHNILKPSQRGIKNMLRKEKREELININLLDLSEKE